MEKINIGVVGLGWWGPKLLRNFQNHHLVNKIYGYDLSKEAIYSALKSGLRFEPVKRYEDLLNNNITSLIIATPPNTHFNLIKLAFENDKHVLITKPPAESLAEFIILEDYVKNKSLVFMVDSTYVYNPALETIKSFLHRNNINNLKSIRILRFGDDLRMHHISRLRNTMFANNIDIVKDLIFHDISILIYLFGDDLKIESIKTFYNLHKSLCDSSFVFLRAKNIPVIIEYSWTFPERRREFQFYYDDKFLFFDDLNSSEKIWQFIYEIKEKISFDYEQKEPLYCEVDHFISCIKNGKEPKTGISFMRKVMEIMEKVNNHKELYK